MTMYHPGRAPLALLSTGLLGATGLACTGGSAGDEPSSPIDDYIQSIDRLPAQQPQVIEGEASAPVAQGDYRCVTQPMEETRQYDELVAYQTNSEAFWPGAILRGDSVYDGQFSQLVFDRAPLTVSISLENLDGAKSATMDSPRLSQFREEMSGILDAEVTGATPANLYTEIEEIHSQEQLDLALGTSVSGIGLPASIKGNFSFDEESVRSRYLVRYTQSYYTVDVDQPRRPSDVFADSVTLEDVSSRVGAGNPPTYVSSITYGRIVVFTFESEYSAEEMSSALEFVYRGGADVSGDVSVTYKDMVSRSNITAYILGGSGGDAAQSLESYEDIMGFIEGGGDYSKESPGAPIAYKLAYLSDNSPVRMSFTSDYEVEQCERVSQRVLATLKGIEVEEAADDSGNDLEVYGTVTVAGSEETIPLFQEDSGNFVRISEGERWPAGDIVAEDVISVTPQSGEVISIEADLWDKDDIQNDTDLGRDTIDVAYESGWRKEVPVRLSGGGTEVVAILELRPI